MNVTYAESCKKLRVKFWAREKPLSATPGQNSQNTKKRKSYPGENHTDFMSNTLEALHSAALDHETMHRIITITPSSPTSKKKKKKALLN